MTAPLAGPVDPEVYITTAGSDSFTSGSDSAGGASAMPAHVCSSNPELVASPTMTTVSSAWRLGRTASICGR
jgi:hypothetical protein